MNFQEEIEKVRMTKKALLKNCKVNKLYSTPRLNDVLYLHYKGYPYIENLEEYTGLKCLWLECNAISEIQGLTNQRELRSLYLHHNLIQKIENLECCPLLDTLNLAHNQILHIDNVGTDILPVLNTLDLSNNRLGPLDGLQALTSCLTLSVLNLSNNRIEDPLFLNVVSAMPELRVLTMTGNPVIRNIPAYRKTITLACTELRYLDDRPVFPRDRACAEAWKRGGVEEERKEHQRWIKAERDKINASVRAMMRLKNKARGVIISDASDDGEFSDGENDDNKPKRQKKLIEEIGHGEPNLDGHGEPNLLVAETQKELPDHTGDRAHSIIDTSFAPPIDTDTGTNVQNIEELKPYSDAVPGLRKEITNGSVMEYSDQDVIEVIPQTRKTIKDESHMLNIIENKNNAHAEDFIIQESPMQPQTKQGIDEKERPVVKKPIIEVVDTHMTTTNEVEKVKDEMTTDNPVSTEKDEQTDLSPVTEANSVNVELSEDSTKETEDANLISPANSSNKLEDSNIDSSKVSSSNTDDRYRRLVDSILNKDEIHPIKQRNKKEACQVQSEDNGVTNNGVSNELVSSGDSDSSDEDDLLIDIEDISSYIPKSLRERYKQYIQETAGKTEYQVLNEDGVPVMTQERIDDLVYYLRLMRQDIKKGIRKEEESSNESDKNDEVIPKEITSVQQNTNIDITTDSASGEVSNSDKDLSVLVTDDNEENSSKFTIPQIIVTDVSTNISDNNEDEGNVDEKISEVNEGSQNNTAIVENKDDVDEQATIHGVEQFIREVRDISIKWNPINNCSIMEYKTEDEIENLNDNKEPLISLKETSNKRIDDNCGNLRQVSNNLTIENSLPRIINATEENRDILSIMQNTLENVEGNVDKTKDTLIVDDTLPKFEEILSTNNDLLKIAASALEEVEEIKFLPKSDDHVIEKYETAEKIDLQNTSENKLELSDTCTLFNMSRNRLISDYRRRNTNKYDLDNSVSSSGDDNIVASSDEMLLPNGTVIKYIDEREDSDVQDDAIDSTQNENNNPRGAVRASVNLEIDTPKIGSMLTIIKNESENLTDISNENKVDLIQEVVGKPPAERILPYNPNVKPNPKLFPKMLVRNPKRPKSDIHKMMFDQPTSSSSCSAGNWNERGNVEDKNNQATKKRELLQVNPSMLGELINVFQNENLTLVEDEDKTKPKRLIFEEFYSDRFNTILNRSKTREPLSTQIGTASSLSDDMFKTTETTNILDIVDEEDEKDDVRASIKKFDMFVKKCENMSENEFTKSILGGALSQKKPLVTEQPKSLREQKEERQGRREYKRQTFEDSGDVFGRLRRSSLHITSNDTSSSKMLEYIEKASGSAEDRANFLKLGKMCDSAINEVNDQVEKKNTKNIVIDVIQDVLNRVITDEAVLNVDEDEDEIERWAEAADNRNSCTEQSDLIIEDFIELSDNKCNDKQMGLNEEKEQCDISNQTRIEDFDNERPTSTTSCFTSLNISETEISSANDIIENLHRETYEVADTLQAVSTSDDSEEWKIVDDCDSINNEKTFDLETLTRQSFDYYDEPVRLNCEAEMSVLFQDGGHDYDIDETSCYIENALENTVNLGDETRFPNSIRCPMYEPDIDGIDSSDDEESKILNDLRNNDYKMQRNCEGSAIPKSLSALEVTTEDATHSASEDNTTAYEDDQTQEDSAIV